MQIEKLDFLRKYNKARDITPDLLNITKSFIDDELDSEHNNSADFYPFAKELDIQKIYKITYDYWYRFMQEQAKSNLKYSPNLQKLLTNSSYKPENMLAFNYIDFFENNKDFRYSFLPIQIENDDIKYEYNADVPNKLNGVLKIAPFEPANLLENAKECNLYLEFKPEHFVEFIELLTQKAFNNKLYLTYDMISLPGQNIDFELHTSYKQLAPYIAILQDLQQKYNYLFTTTPSIPLTLKINDFICFDECNGTEYQGYEKIDALCEFFDDTLMEFYKKVGNYSGLIPTDKGNMLTLTQCIQRSLKTAFLKDVKATRVKIAEREFPEEYVERGGRALAQYTAFNTQLYNDCKKEIPFEINKQINSFAERIVNNLKEGKCVLTADDVYCVTIPTQCALLDLEHTKEECEQLISVNKPFNLEYIFNCNLAKEIFEIFNMEKHLLKDTTIKNVTPYLQEAKIPVEAPWLSFDTISEIQKSNSNAFSFDE